MTKNINETKEGIEEIFSLVKQIKDEGRQNIDMNTILLFANLEKKSTQTKTTKEILEDWVLLAKEGKRLPWEPAAAVPTVTPLPQVAPPKQLLADAINEKKAELAAAITVLVNKFVDDTGLGVTGFESVIHRNHYRGKKFMITGINIQL